MMMMMMILVNKKAKLTRGIDWGIDISGGY